MFFYFPFFCIWGVEWSKFIDEKEEAEIVQFEFLYFYAFISPFLLACNHLLFKTFITKAKHKNLIKFYISFGICSIKKKIQQTKINNNNDIKT